MSRQVEELAMALAGPQGPVKIPGGFRTLCPAHDDYPNPSLEIIEGHTQPVVFTCRAGCPQQSVVNALKARGLYPLRGDSEHKEHTERKGETWTPLAPISEDATPPPAGMGPRRPSMRWTYRNADGRVLCHVDRFEPTTLGGRKDIIPLTWCVSQSGARSWQRKALPKPRPLYGLDRLAARPDAPVLITEGEKCADAGDQEVKSYISMTWSGGGKAVHFAEWTPLKGRRVVVWADNDGPGKKTAIEIKTLLDRLNNTRESLVRSLQLPVEWPEGYDIADAAKAGWTPAQILAFIETGSVPAASLKPVGEDGNPHFVALGVNGVNYYYRRVRNPQVLVYPASAHRRQVLFDLAPKSYWESRYMNITGVDWDSAVSDTMERCKVRGLFSLEQTRGRGAWPDDGRVIFHTGRRLYVDGVETPLDGFRSAYIYQASHADLGLDLSTPLSDHEARRVLLCCRKLLWRKPVSGDLLAGWIVIAPFCGALRWRSHIWLTGESGCGKSLVLAQIMLPLMGGTAEYVEGATTAAGVRASLHGDARPVIFDEAERREGTDARIQELLDLIVVSSSGAGKIAKGTPNQTVISQVMRSCFCLASVNTVLDRQAVLRRMTALELLKNDSRANPKQWGEMQQRIAKLPPGASLIARTLRYFKVLEQNVLTFQQAVAEELQDVPEGDQFGPLLAGAFLLTSTAVLTLKRAREFVKSRDWSEHRLDDSEKDEQKLVARFATSVVTVNSVGGHQNRSVGELILISVDRAVDAAISKELAEAHLLRIGVQPSPESGYIFIAHHNAELERIFRGTVWEHNWRDGLERLPQALRHATGIFAAGRPAPAVGVPLNVIFPQLKDNSDAIRAESTTKSRHELAFSDVPPVLCGGRSTPLSLRNTSPTRNPPLRFRSNRA